jgi:hypothetical protein
LNICRIDSEKDHAGMAVAQSEHQLAKVAIVGYQDSTLAGGDYEYFDVWKVCSVIGSNLCRIVTSCIEVCCDSRITASIDKEFQC